MRLLPLLLLLACTPVFEPVDPTVPLTIEGAWFGIDAAGVITELLITEGPEPGGCVGFGLDTLRRPADRIRVRFNGTLTDTHLQISSLDGWAVGWVFDATATSDEISGLSSSDHWGPTQLTLTRTSTAPGC